MSDRTAHDHQHFSSDDEERLHFQKIVESYRSYGSFAKQRVNIAIKNYKKLPEYQQDLVKDFLPNCAKLFQCIEHNQNLINLLLEDVHAMFHNEEFQKVDKDISCLGWRRKRFEQRSHLQAQVLRSGYR